MNRGWDGVGFRYEDGNDGEVSLAGVLPSWGLGHEFAGKRKERDNSSDVPVGGNGSGEVTRVCMMKRSRTEVEEGKKVSEGCDRTQNRVHDRILKGSLRSGKAGIVSRHICAQLDNSESKDMAQENCAERAGRGDRKSVV